MSVEVDVVDGANLAEREWEAEASRALNVLSTVFQLKPETLNVEHHAYTPRKPPQAVSPSLPSPPPPTPERADPPAASAPGSRGARRAVASGANERKPTCTLPNGSKMWLPNSMQRRPVSNARGSTRAPTQSVGVTPTMLAAAAASAATANAKR